MLQRIRSQDLVDNSDQNKCSQRLLSNLVRGEWLLHTHTSKAGTSRCSPPWGGPGYINQEVFDLYDAYAHNKLERREFIEKLSIYAVGGLTVPSLLSFIMPDYEKQEVRSNDIRIESDYVSYDSPKGGGQIKGLFSKPKESSGQLPGMVPVPGTV